MTIRQLIDQEEFLNQPRANVPQKEDYSEIITAMESLTEQMINSSFDVKVEDEVTISNLDQIKLYLRQELKIALSPVIDAVKKLDKKTEKVEVSNLRDIIIPESKDIVIPDYPKETSLSQETITEMRHLFMRLGDVIKKSLVVNIPQANVVVNPPSIPAPIVNVQSQDLTPILSALAPLERFFNDDVEPFVVKFQNEKFFEDLKEALKDSNRQMAAFSGGPSIVGLKNAGATIINPATEETNQAIAGLVTQPYDYISLSPASQPTTITFKRGGSGGVTVATLTLTYSGSDIATVTKS